MARQLSVFGFIVLFVLLIAVACISGGASAVFAIKYANKAAPQPTPQPTPNLLEVQAEQAITVNGEVNKNHALYLSRLFQGLSMRLAIDARSAHRFNTTSELSQIVTDAGSLAIQGVREFDYPLLPAFIKEHVLVPSFGDPAIDKQFTVDETLDFAERLSSIGIAFATISEK